MSGVTANPGFGPQKPVQRQNTIDLIKGATELPELSTVKINTLTEGDIDGNLDKYKPQITAHVERSKAGNTSEVIEGVQFLLSNITDYDQIVTLQDAVEVASTCERWTKPEWDSESGKLVQLNIGDAYKMWVAVKNANASASDADLRSALGLPDE